MRSLQELHGRRAAPARRSVSDAAAHEPRTLGAAGAPHGRRGDVERAGRLPPDHRARRRDGPAEPAARASSTCSPRRAAGAAGATSGPTCRAPSRSPARARATAARAAASCSRRSGPGTGGLARAASRARASGCVGPARASASAAAAAGTRPCSWAAASAPRRCSCLQDELRRRRRPVLLGFRSAAHAEAREPVRGRRPRWPPTTARSGRRALVTELLREELDARRRGHRVRLRPAADARGGARALRRARRAGPARAGVRHGLRLRRLLRLRGAHPRAATCGCAWTGRCSTRRPSWRVGVASATIELCGVPLRGPVLNGSGTFDAIAARRAFGDALLERFPFDAFVSKTITLEPRAGQPAAAPVGDAGRADQLDRAAQQGARGLPRHDLPQLAELPVPLVVSVMGFTRDELAALVARGGRARRGGADRAERVLPERGDRAW